MFTIDSRSRVPIYEQLKQNIISQIANGILGSDDQLPSVRSLARDLGVNPNTVQKAYQELESGGFIYQAAGRGSFVSPNETLTQSLSDKYLGQLRQVLTNAYNTNIDFDVIISLANEIYRRDSI